MAPRRGGARGRSGSRGEEALPTRGRREKSRVGGIESAEPRRLENQGRSEWARPGGARRPEATRTGALLGWRIEVSWGAPVHLAPSGTLPTPSEARRARGPETSPGPQVPRRFPGTSTPGSRRRPRPSFPPVPLGPTPLQGATGYGVQTVALTCTEEVLPHSSRSVAVVSPPPDHTRRPRRPSGEPPWNPTLRPPESYCLSPTPSVVVPFVHKKVSLQISVETTETGLTRPTETRRLPL